MVRKWYVARTRPRVEALAASELFHDGIETFLPSVISPLPRGESSEGPLFPGYLFVRCDPETDGWPTVRKSGSVFGWVNFGGVVPALPDEDVSCLKRHVDDMNREGGLWKRYRIGEKVNVVSQTVSGFAEVLEESKSPQSRVKVMLEFLGRMVTAQVPRENIRPLENIDERRETHKQPPRRTRGRGRWISGFGPSSFVSN